MAEEESATQGTEKASSADAKADKFREVATRRVNAACHAIELLESLTNSSYRSTKEQRDKIIAALEERVEAVRAVYAEFDAKAEKAAPKTNYVEL